MTMTCMMYGFLVFFVLCTIMGISIVFVEAPLLVGGIYHHEHGNSLLQAAHLYIPIV